MDKEQLDQLEGELNEEFISNASEIKFVNHSNFTKTKDGNIGDILSQRHEQRQKLFKFSLWFVALTTLFVLVLIALQAYLNFHGYTVQLVNTTTLQIIVSGIFVQFVGLVGIITKSIWNDKPYLDAGVIDYKKKK